VNLLPPRSMLKMRWAAAAVALAIGAPAHAENPPIQDRLGPAVRMPVRTTDPEASASARPATTLPTAVTPAQAAKPAAAPLTGPAGRLITPKRLAKLQARGLIDDPADPSAAADRPPLVSLASTPLPSTPAFPEGTRLIVAPIPANMPVRIPNLLSGPKRQIITAGNPLLTPALPIGTPTVCNLDGTASLAGLAPFKREIVVEVTAPPAALSLDESPYLQAPDASDESDPPADRHAIPRDNRAPQP